MEFGRTEIEGIYNGHLSWRRLRGVKINPIYQENDCSRNGVSSDTQSDTSVPVGEIQIEMYESLPRHRLVRHSRSVPNMPYVSSTAISTIPVGLKEHKVDGLSESAEETVRSSGFSHSQSSNNIDNDAHDNRSEDATTLHRSSRKKGNTEIEHNAAAERGHRNRLARQTGASATSDDPDAISPAPSPGKTSVSSSAPNSSSSSSHTQQNSTLKRKGTPRFFKSRNYLSKKQLSVVQEDRSVIEVDDVTKDSVVESRRTVVNDHEENIIDNCNIDDSDHISCLNDAVTYHVDDTSCHSMNAPNQQPCGCNPVVSTRDGDIDFKENIANKQASTTEMDFSVSSSSEDILQIPLNKDVFSLDKIALMPSISHIHNTSPVSSIDHINNNNETVPDLMLQHNGILHGVSRYNPINGYNKQSPGFDGHDHIALETQELKVMYSLSNNSSLDSENKSSGKEPLVSDCDCGGRPTLKCSCGRKALQNILKEKYVIKNIEEYMQENSDKSLTEDTTSASCISTPAKCYNDKDKQPFNGRIYAHFDLDILEITESPVKESPMKKIEPLKSILHNPLSPAKSSSNVDRKIVSFSEDTVFNEDKGVVYLKECISPSDLALLISEMENNDDGVENPAFDDIIEDANNSTDKKKSKKRSKKKNKIASNDSLILKVSDLNTPAYMQQYLNGVSKTDVVRTPSLSNAKKAPPVSIEAVGGTLVEDPSFDEINVMRDEEDDEFEECRRRRKLKYSDEEDGDTWLKKTRRRKKIKICLIVVFVIALVITGIALAIHYGAPHVASSGLSSQRPTGGLPGFPIL